MSLMMCPMCGASVEGIKTPWHTIEYAPHDCVAEQKGPMPICRSWIKENFAYINGKLDELYSQYGEPKK